MASSFLCDGMLGSLARWLRLLGVDTTYAGSALDDAAVLERCRQEGRILLTRDEQLLRRARTGSVPAHALPEATVLEQVKVLVVGRAIRLEPERFFSRCTRCNAELVATSRQAIAGRVPPAVLDRHEAFWSCPACRHVYWKGTHVEEIHRKILELGDAVAA